MNFLSNDQRTRAIKLLVDAPDEIILSAMVDLRRYRHLEEGTKNNFSEVVDDLQERRTHDEPVAVDQRGTAIVVEEVRKNVSPGTPSITKIGAIAKDYILEALKLNVQPPPRYSEHLKLLWSRGEIKFDGESYYL